MQRTRVFWLGVPTLVMVFRRTTTRPQVSVCVPFSFAHTEVVVLVFPLSYYINGRLTKYCLHPLVRIIFLWLNKELLMESKELRVALARE